MIHFGCLGYSPRTTSEAQVVRFGAELLRVETDVGWRPAGRSRWRSATARASPSASPVDGAAERSVERLLARFPVLVFTPDRLRLVQGAPALRRAYFDRVLARLWPAPAAASAEYARALSQRNHLLRRVRAGRAERRALDPWDELLAEAGAAADRRPGAPVHAAGAGRSPSASRRRWAATRARLLSATGPTSRPGSCAARRR